LYTLLLSLEQRSYTTKYITKETRQEKFKELPKLILDKIRLKNHIQKILDEKMPALEPIVKSKVKYIELEKERVIERSSKKDIFIQAQEAFFGHGRQKNYKEALEIYQEAERKGISKAANCLGLMYLKGEGVAQDYEKAYSHFNNAKNSTDNEGKADGFYWIGHMHFNNLVGSSSFEDNIRIAVANFEKAASMEQSQAMCDLGLIYEHGLSGVVDFDKARLFYERSVRLNNPMAMDNLGVFLLREDVNFSNPENNKKLAFDLFNSARLLGYKKSLTNLGIMFLKGIHVSKDLVNAKDLFKKAASGDQPDIEAKYYLAYFKLKEASMSQDESKFEEVADELRYVLALNKKHSDAHYYLGFLYENGLGTDKDLRSAFKHFQKAMESDPNNSKAKYKVANFYVTGEGLSYPDKVKAFDLYQQAAKQGNSDALLALG
jgi:TPR repeat protein